MLRLCLILRTQKCERDSHEWELVYGYIRRINRINTQEVKYGN